MVRTSAQTSRLARARRIGCGCVLGIFASLVAWPLAAQTPTTGQTPTTQTPATQTPTTAQTPTTQQPEQNPANPPSDLATLQRGTAPTEITPAARPNRPYRGLFGTPTKNLEPRLTFEGTVGAGTGGNPAQDQAGGGPSGGGSAAGGGSGAGTGSATLTYSWTRQKMGVNANNVYFVDYYPNGGGN